MERRVFVKKETLFLSRESDSNLPRKRTYTIEVTRRRIEEGTPRQSMQSRIAMKDSILEDSLSLSLQERLPSWALHILPPGQEQNQRQD
jgi:hypothetical protein